MTKIHDSGKIIREIFEFLKDKIKEGVSTGYLDDLIMKQIKKAKAESAFLGYNHYPANTCISVNEEIIHGIPDNKRILKNRDIVTIDIGVLYNEYIADASMTYAVGQVNPEAKKLMDVTYNALYNAIKVAIPGNRIGDIGYSIQSYVESFHYNVIRDFVGHGVGKELHEDPAIPNYGKKGTGVRLKEGMVLAIEPMVSMGTYNVVMKENKWTAITADHSLAAHYEHTIGITKDGALILTI